MFKTEVEPLSAGLVVSLQSFEHFDIISVVLKSTDHGNLLSIYFENNIDSFQHPCQVLFHEKSCASDRKKIAPSFHHFHDLCFYRPMNMQEIA